MKTRILSLFFVVSVLLVLTSVCLADRDGNLVYCTIDKYGCYETADDGSTYYTMFWSEAARQHFMGNLTKPYTNVVNYCYDCQNGILSVGRTSSDAPASAKARSLLRSHKSWSHGSDSHGEYNGETINDYYDDGSMDISQNWNYSNGGHLDLHVTITGHNDGNDVAMAEGSETYTSPNGQKKTIVY